MITENNFKNWIILLPILGVLSTSIMLTYLLMGKILEDHNNALKVITENKKNLIKANIKNRIDTLCQVIDQNFQVDDHQYLALIFKKNQQLLNETIFNKKDYIFAYDMNGNTIAHANKKHIGKNRLNLQVNNRYLVKEAIENPKLKEGFFMTYTASYNPNKKQSREKISYIKSPKYVDWVVGTGIYLDDYNSEMAAVKKQLESELKQTLNVVVYISIIVTVIGLVIMSYLSNSINAIIRRYQEKLLNKNAELEQKVEQRIKEQNSIMTLFDNAETVLYKWEYINHQFKYISKNVENIIGFRKDEIVNKSFIYTKFIHKNDLQLYIDENKNSIHFGKNYYEHTPYRLISKDGSIKWIREYKLLIKNEKGKISHVIGYITDITHLKQHELIEIENKKTLALKDLISNLAHQWRQPLSVITTAASGMKIQNELNILTPQLINEYNQNIIEHCDYLSKTIDSFNDISIESDEKSLLCMNTVLDKVASLLRQSLQDQNIELIINVHDKKKFLFNEQSLLQLIIHLLNNSIDALKRKSDDKVIFIDSYVKQEALIIKIQDSADGISEEIMEKMYEPYFTTKHQSLGTGLGLCLSRNIIDNLEGFLSIENQNFNYQGKQFFGAYVNIKIPLNTTI